MLQDFSQFQNQNVQMFGYVFRDTNGQMAKIMETVHGNFLNETCTAIDQADWYVKGNSKRPYWNTDRRKYRVGNVCLFIWNKGYFCQCMWMTLKWLVRIRILAPVWKEIMKNEDVDEPTSFLYHVYLGRTQRECKPTETVIEQYTKMFESRMSAGVTAKFRGCQKPHAQTAAWSYDMEGLLKNAWSDTVNWQTRKWSNCTQFQVPAWMITISRKRGTWISWRNVRTMLTNCLEMLVLGTN